MPADFNDLVFPQVALFAVLILILTWVLSKDMVISLLVGGVALYLGMTGELEELGIGKKFTAYKCADYLDQGETGQGQVRSLHDVAVAKKQEYEATTAAQ